MAELPRPSLPAETTRASTSSTVPVQTNHSFSTPPELERTLSLLSSHRTVLGYLLLLRESHPVRIIRHSGVVFEGEQGRKYAAAVAKIVETVQAGLLDVGAGHSDADEVRFMRIRTRRHELMISPDERYLLAVLHDPNS